MLIHPSNLDFIKAFLGTLQAGMVAVPAMAPRANEGVQRLIRIANNADIAAVLAADDTLERVRRLDLELFAQLNEKRAVATATEPVPNRLVQTTEAPQRPAFLQYTSGSTGSPKGVIVTHGNLLDNQRAIADAFGHDSTSTVVVGWLPLYHDMGPIGNVLQPLFLGRPCILMSPMDFLMRPVRWLRAIEKYRGTTSGGPNFSYDLCVQKVSETEAASIDLSSWRLAFNGAEPVRAATLANFAQRFVRSGFSVQSFYPCYGLAECTLFVAGGRRDIGPQYLRNGVLQPVTPDGDMDGTLDYSHYVTSGVTRHDNILRIVNTEQGTPCAVGEIGEIWVSGPSVAHGYWGQKELSESVFGCTLSQEPARQFFRTGDLGFQDASGQLFVVGRLKDIIIVRGVNYYAEDIEAVVGGAHPLLSACRTAAFSIDAPSGEKLIVLAEAPRKGMIDEEGRQAVDAISGEITEKFGITPAVVALTKYGALPVTTSGKIKRKQCKADYLASAISSVA